MKNKLFLIVKRTVSRYGTLCFIKTNRPFDGYNGFPVIDWGLSLVDLVIK